MEPSSETEVDLENPLVSLEWSHFTKLPTGMQHAQAVVVDDKVYVGGGMTTDPKEETNIYVFDHTIESPKVTPIPTPGPTCWSTLATIHSRLVLAGGARDRINATNEVWALQDDGCTWDSQAFPAMPQACWGAAALSTNNHLILAGGVENHPSAPLSTVQIYNVNSKQWALAESLPTSCYFMKGVLHNGDWYLAGGRWQYHEIFHASLESLIAMSEGRKENFWKTDLPKLSRQCCSISVYLDQLIAIGGMMNGGQVDSIQKYSFNKQRWVDVGLLDQPSDSVCTVILPSKELLLIGGNIEGTYHKFSDSVSKSNIKVFRSLDDSFTQYAFAKIEIAAGIPIYNSIACGEMNANAAELLEATTGQPEQKTADGSSRDVIRKWLDGKSGSTTWRVLLELFRKLKMEDVANKIERLFTDKEAYRYKQKPASVGDQLQTVTVKQPRIIIEAESTTQPEQLPKLLPAKPVEVQPSPQTNPEDHQTFVISSHGDLRGAEIIGETCCHISGEKPLTYEWKGYGIRIQIPKGALPPDVISAELRIRASLAGQYEFPEDHELISGIFWISFPHQFLRSAILDIQHSLALTHPSQCSSLSFVVAKCTQKGLPYSFKLLEGGVFTPHSSYGSISIAQFSGLAITRKRRCAPNDTQPLPKAAKPDRGDTHEPAETQYSAQLYYLPTGIVNKWILHFLIFRDLDVCNAIIQQKYTKMNAEPGPYQQVLFEADAITLDISEDGAVSGGWSLFPLMHPGLTREIVDTYKPGQQIPSCQIQLKWTRREEEPEELLLRVQLIGAKKPNNYFAIARDPIREGSGIPSLPVTPIRPDLNDLADVSSYLLPLRTDDILHLGLALGLSFTTLQPLMQSQTSFLQGMLIAWLQGKDDVGKKGGHTWRALVAGLREPLLRQTQIAEKIERERCT